MKEFMQKFDKNKDGRIEMSEVRNCSLPEIESVTSAVDEVRLQMAFKMVDLSNQSCYFIV